MIQYYFGLRLRLAIAISLATLLPFAVYSQKPVFSYDPALKIAGLHNVFGQPSGIGQKARDNRGDWKSDFSVPGIIGSVYATASDGKNLYIGGNFGVAGSIAANSIVKWDGQKWHTVGMDEENGIPGNAPDGIPTVRAVTYADGKLFVGGQFSRAGSVDANGIAYWDGNKWNSLGSGPGKGVIKREIFENDTIVQPGTVLTLFAHDHKLYVGGDFQLAGDSPANGIAVWDMETESWGNMNGGLKDIEGTSPVYGYGIAAFENYIYVGGKFNSAGDVQVSNIAKWDGHSWTSAGEAAAAIYDLKADKKGNLFAAGYYHDGDSTGVCGLGIWNGEEWKPLPGPAGYHSTVSKIHILDDFLYACGSFKDREGKESSLARWDGKDWEVFSGLSQTDIHIPAVIRGIEKADGKLYMAGEFTQADSLYVVNVAVWNNKNNRWEKLDDGTGNQGIYDGTILTVEKNGTDIYAGGSFSIAGGKLARSIARWNGSEWQSLGSDKENGIRGSVFTILINGDDIYAGGYFGQAGGSEAFHVAQWDGKKWKPLGIGVGGFHGAHVRDLALLGNYLYVAGYFSAVGDKKNHEIQANSIARFNLENRTWEAVGKGIENESGVPGRVYDMEVLGNRIAIGGEFNLADGKEQKNFTLLENLDFSAPANNPEYGIYGLVNAVEIINNEIYIGGLLQSSSGKSECGILKWNGSEWSAINGNLWSDNGEVFISDMEPFRKGFIAGGFFRYAGEKEVNNIAYYDGNEWLDIEGGLEPGVTDFIIVANKLYVTGPPVISSELTQGIGLVEFEFPDEVTSSENPVQDESALSNYPNPFIGNTTIRYTVPEAAWVRLSLYDQAGREIRNLVSEFRQPGNYRMPFSTGDLSGGIYFCRMICNGYSETTKLIITR